VSGLRAARDHVTVLQASLERSSRTLLASWRDAGSAHFDQDVLRPLAVETDRLARAIADADHQIDTARAALRRLGSA
jgi:hypothetical protein